MLIYLNFTTMKLHELSDTQLVALCERYGAQARFWRQKFAGVLPEVFRRKLFLKRRCGSIFEFAKKLAGMSEEQVRLVLNLEKKFEDTPILKALLVNGEVSANKLVRVASIATPENQEVLAEQVKILPKTAIDTLVRDEKYCREKISLENQSLPVHSNLQQNLQNATIQLLPEVTAKLLELQQKGIDVNMLLLELLAKRELEIALEKEKISNDIQPTTSRYFAAKIKKLLVREYGTKCAVPTCKKEAEVIHHTNRYSMSKNNDPYYLAPLCKDHHVIAHSIDRKFQMKMQR